MCCYKLLKSRQLYRRTSPLTKGYAPGPHWGANTQNGFALRARYMHSPLPLNKLSGSAYECEWHHRILTPNRSAIIKLAYNTAMSDLETFFLNAFGYQEHQFEEVAYLHGWVY